MSVPVRMRQGQHYPSLCGQFAWKAAADARTKPVERRMGEAKNGEERSSFCCEQFLDFYITHTWCVPAVHHRVS